MTDKQSDEQPVKKTWAVFFYLVCRAPDGTHPPDDQGAFLNAKAVKIADAIKSARSAMSPVSHDDMYVAIRTLLNPGFLPNGDTLSVEIAGSLTAPPPSTSDTYFPHSPHTGHPIADDMAGFFKWAVKHCPADNYAVFFWGHSFGPAGLFEVGTPIVVPTVPDAAAGMATPGADDRYGVPAISLDELSRAPAASLPDLAVALKEIPRRVKLVVFQDCWMSTLETAFELQAKVATVVASQSLIPIGRLEDNDDPNVCIWDYKAVFRHLDDPRQLVHDLNIFYSAQQPYAWANLLPNPSVPYAALDLTAVKTLAPPLKIIVNRLRLPANSIILDEAFAENAYIKHVRVSSPDGIDIDAGSEALIDVRTWVDNINPRGDAILAKAVQNVKSALNQLVISSEEAYSLPKPLGFRGVSVLGGPARLGGPINPDDFIRPHLNETSYGSLVLSRMTSWPLVAFYQRNWLQPLDTERRYAMDKDWDFGLKADQVTTIQELLRDSITTAMAVMGKLSEEENSAARSLVVVTTAQTKKPANSNNQASLKAKIDAKAENVGYEITELSKAILAAGSRMDSLLTTLEELQHMYPTDVS
jgi:hypothetical protein